MVENTKVTGKGLLRLHESLPNCTFYADPPAMEEYCTLVLQKEPDNVELHKQRAELLARYHAKMGGGGRGPGQGHRTASRTTLTPGTIGPCCL